MRKAICNNSINANDATNKVIRLMNNGFAYCFEEARLAAIEGSDFEHNKYVGKASTIMRVITSKDGDLQSPFHKINGTQVEISNTSYKLILIDDHEEAKRGKIKSQLPLEHKFVLCRTFKKITENLDFHLTFKTAELQDIT